MAFLDACEPEDLQSLNVRTRQQQISGHDATEAHGTMFVQQETNNNVSLSQDQRPLATPGFSPAAARAGASAGQVNQPHVPVEAGGIAGRGAPRVPRTRATLDPQIVLQIFFTRHDPSSCNAWATQQGVTPKAVRDIWNLRTWRQ
jgi:hypothetical protein